MDPPKPALKIVRISSHDQLDELIDLANDAFIDDPVMDLMVPGRHEHPESARAMWWMTINEEYGKKGTVMLAARREEDGEQGKFLAFAIWQRVGSSEVAQCWQGDNWNKQRARLGTMWANFYYFVLRQAGPGISLEKAIDAGAAVERAYKFYPTERWRLSLLAVSPKCQRTGIGKRLLQWGLDRCEEEGVPATLESSIAGRPLYEKMGFREIGSVSFNEGKSSMPAMLRPVGEI
ncbi:hypothetical protein F53441_1478 [Fusarium austroafricanum]|uniref:N-acetyltransferase domain-containing protein n=1 Tax=Fusarium austroafricanum TaxID=2364996 RepID=A0A8H4P3Z9_9HYPO|nr:hypothetical protein F53441_1478 [Fusarium austroafricanum]